jgi:hypothetical protein
LEEVVMKAAEVFPGDMLSDGKFNIFVISVCDDRDGDNMCTYVWMNWQSVELRIFTCRCTDIAFETWHNVNVGTLPENFDASGVQRAVSS